MTTPNMPIPLTDAPCYCYNIPVHGFRSVLQICIYCQIRNIFNPTIHTRTHTSTHTSTAGNKKTPAPPKPKRSRRSGGPDPNQSQLFG